MNSLSFYKSRHFIIPVIALAINFLLFEILSYINAGRLLPFSMLHAYLEEGWMIIIQTIAVFYLVYYSVVYFNKKYAASPNSLKRFTYEIIFISVAGFIIQEIARLAFIKYSLVPENPVTLKPKLRQLQMMCMAFLLVIYALVTSFRIFTFMQQKQLELMKWQSEFAQSQFEALKNQLNPHFLFNSLSILTQLVYLDANRAELFIEKLSKTYRYLLEQRDKDKVPLKKELEFFEGYRFLVEQRFGNKLQFTVNIEGTPLQKELPPQALMIAMEYIIANNSMSALKPLIVKIASTADNLLIKYCCQPKTQIEQTSEKQLTTLKERYRYFAPHRQMEVTAEGEWNTITYPLL